jgi:hypothetical protein
VCDVPILVVSQNKLIQRNSGHSGWTPATLEVAHDCREHSELLVTLAASWARDSARTFWFLLGFFLRTFGFRAGSGGSSWLHRWGSRNGYANVMMGFFEVLFEGLTGFEGYVAVAAMVVKG